MKVIDASMLIDFLLGAPSASHLQAQFDDDLFAPDLLLPEVMRQLRKFVQNKAMSATDADTQLGRVLDAQIEYLPISTFASTIWEWRHNISPFDACYVALALDLRSPLMTSDRRLAAAAFGIVPVISGVAPAPAG